MSRWKYNISIVFKNNGEDREIESHCVRKLFIEHDYVNKYTPTMYCTLDIDKNLFDAMLLNASTATVLLIVDKINVESEMQTTESVYSYECEYFVDNDINYNKEIDYQGDNKDRKDIFREVNIGLMFKNCIEYNKQTNNETVIESTMMNIVGSFIQDIPTLIEPFTYNDSFDQLIIPPHDSLTKTLKFLNELRVFYDTPYRVFFEPDALYIVSSSGKPVPKKTDKFDTVYFIVYPIDNPNANTLGMNEDTKNQAYVINISALDTDYKIDHDTSKDFNNIKSVLNPSLENSLPALGSVSSIIGNISSAASVFQDTISDYARQMSNIPSTMSSIKNDFVLQMQREAANTSTSISCISKGIEAILAMPEPPPEDSSDSDAGDGSGPKFDKETGIITNPDGSQEKTLSPEEKNRIVSELNKIINSIQHNHGEYSNVYDDYKQGMSDMNKILGNISNSPGYIGAVTPINTNQDTVSVIKDVMTTVGIDSDACKQYCDTSLRPYILTCNNQTSLCKTAQQLIESTGITMNEDTGIEEQLAGLISSQSGFGAIASSTLSNITKHASFISSYKDTVKSVAPSINKLKSTVTNLKGIFSNSKINLSIIGDYSNKMLQGIASLAERNAAELAKAGLSYSSLSGLTKDINSVKDITSLGKLGINSLDMNIDLGKDAGTGTKIIKIDNDNANKLKNIKADIENSKNKFTLDSDDLDVTIFNINMKYIIRNYDAHSDKDGLFLLDKRMDIFVREDDKLFKCHSNLTFRKVAGDDGASEAAKAIGQTPSEEELKDLREQMDEARRRISIADSLSRNKYNPVNY